MAPPPRAESARAPARAVPRVSLRRPLGVGDHRGAGRLDHAGRRGSQAGGAEPPGGAGRALPGARHRDRRRLRGGVRDRAGGAGHRRRGGGRAGAAVAVAVTRPGDPGYHRYVARIPAPPEGSGLNRQREDAMEIILREDVQHLGAAGDVVKVKDGYARNYLLPKGLAYPATEANKKKIAYEAERIARQRATEKTAAQTEAGRLADGQLTFAVKVGEEDKLYGSITAGAPPPKTDGIGIHVDKRKIDLSEPIRELGEYTVGIKLHPDVRPEIQVSVVKE